LRSALLPLAASGLTIAVLSAVSYLVGRQIDPELAFLDPNRAPTIDEASVAQPMAYALRSREYNDAVFIGDSTCRTGVNPAALPFTSFNLGSLRGLGPTGFLLTVEAYLHGHPAPKMVVIVASPFCFEVDPATLGAAEFGERLAAAYGPELGRSPVESAALITRRGAVSAFLSNDVRNLPLVGLERETYLSLESKMRAGRGFFSLPDVNRPKGVAMNRPEHQIHHDWDDGIRAIARECERHRVKLLIRFTPMAEAVRNARDWTQLDPWASELESAHPNVHVARPMVLLYPHDCMWDGVHLSAHGVERFMPQVAKDMLQPQSIVP
jgi:hypothetical protein